MSDETSTTVANPDPSPTLRIPLVVGLAFVTAVLLVDPVGNFPLNDDWDFALTTWKLAETGELRAKSVPLLESQASGPLGRPVDDRLRSAGSDARPY